ncbi:MAG: GNAT family N-acetyltransferase [Sphingomicrobium sp.]
MAEVAAETERLILRNWDPADEATFYDIMNTPAVMEHLGGPQSRDAWHSAFERILSFNRDFGHTFWLIEDRATGELLGFCGLKRVNAPGAADLTGTPEIGWRLRQDAWGKGYAKEAAIASLDLGFGKLGYGEIIALTIPANLPSQQLMERLGMRRRAELDFRDMRYGDELNPAIAWSVSAAEWPAARARALT